MEAVEKAEIAVEAEADNLPQLETVSADTAELPKIETSDKEESKDSSLAEIKRLRELLSVREQELQVAATYGSLLLSNNQSLSEALSETSRENEQLLKLKLNSDKANKYKKRLDQITQYVVEVDDTNADLVEKTKQLESQKAKLRNKIVNQPPKAEHWKLSAQNKVVEKCKKFKKATSKPKTLNTAVNTSPSLNLPRKRKIPKPLCNAATSISKVASLDIGAIEHAKKLEIEARFLRKELAVAEEAVLHYQNAFESQDTVKEHFHMTLQTVKYYLYERFHEIKQIDEEALFDEALRVPSYKWFNHLHDLLLPFCEQEIKPYYYHSTAA